VQQRLAQRGHLAGEGNSGGPGNPFARKVASLRKALLDSVSEQDLKEIVLVLKLKAQRGDLAAVRLLFQYCIGRPEPVKDPDRMDADEWDRLRQMSVPHGQHRAVTEQGLPAGQACEQAEVAWPHCLR